MTESIKTVFVEEAGSLQVKEEIKVEVDPFEYTSDQDGEERPDAPSQAGDMTAQLPQYYFQQHLYAPHFMLPAAPAPRNKRKSVPRKVLRPEPDTETDDKVGTKPGEKKYHKPFACNLCDKSYTSKQQLKIHTRSHTGERPYICGICKKDFKDRWKLTLHSQTHTGLKPFECDKCDKKYTTKYQLTTHYRIHTREKLFICEVCTRQFVERCKLEKHKGIHLGLKPFHCDICDKQYRQKSHLKFHIESAHADVMNIINKKFK